MPDADRERHGAFLKGLPWARPGDTRRAFLAAVEMQLAPEGLSDGGCKEGGGGALGGGLR